MCVCVCVCVCACVRAFTGLGIVMYQTRIGVKQIPVYAKRSLHHADIFINHKVCVYVVWRLQVRLSLKPHRGSVI